MARAGLDQNTVIQKAAQLVNERGMEQVTLKILADNLGIKSPSLYNHIKGLDDLKKQLMLYGWGALEERIIHAIIGLSGYDAVKAMCFAFYDYAAENPGVFDVMLWYNKFENDEMEAATSELMSVIFKIAKSLQLPDQYCFHLIRTFRGFLEGFFLLGNRGSFGHPLPVLDSFALSVDILIAGIKALEGNWREAENNRWGEK